MMALDVLRESDFPAEMSQNDFYDTRVGVITGKKSFHNPEPRTRMVELQC